MPLHDPRPGSLTPPRVRVEGHARLLIDSGWEAAACAPDSHVDPTSLDELAWMPATVPGTAASALQAAGDWRPGEPSDLDAEDWWFRTQFESPPVAAGEEVLLRFDGIATVAELFLNGTLLLESESMFAAHALDVGSLLQPEGNNDLAIRCRALAPLLLVRRMPRARWRTKLADNRLRFFRTMLLGRCPGFAAGPAAVGPWRPVWLERRRGLAVSGAELRTRCEGEAGVLSVRLRAHMLDGTPIETADVVVSDAEAEASLRVEDRDGGFDLSGELRIPSVRRWWPHTHGDPALYAVSIRLTGCTGETLIDAGRIGFRELAAGPEVGHDVLADGIDLHVNGVRVFARGAVWTPDDFVGMAPGRARLREALERVRAAGMNMIRIPGTAAYESPDFHDLCDELGILIWQDFMFANFDYPFADDEFRATVEAEAREQLAALTARPSLAVLCGNSEVEQQVGMLGLDIEMGRGEWFGELLPALIERAGADAIYIPSAPCGGGLPFRPDRGVANYFGVGGYRRPLSDARLAEVRFAAECLAFANVPEPAGVEAILPGAPADVVVHHPRWKAGVPRDAGTGWDFDDVRDHYLQELFGVEPAELRRYDHERYLELSRAVSAEAMSAVFGEWRRGASPCGGGLVLWLRDLVPGAGWGLVDHSGVPKQAYHALRRALAPTAVWLTDKGLGGVGVHVAHDGPQSLHGTLRVTVYGEDERPLAEADEDLRLDGHTVISQDLETMLGRFLDASWAYRFGPPARAVVASLQVDGEEKGSARTAFFFPAGAPTEARSAEQLGLSAQARPDEGGAVLELRSESILYAVRIRADGLEADDDAFSLERGRTRRVGLRRVTPDVAAGGSISIEALNLRGRLTVPVKMTS